MAESTSDSNKINFSFFSLKRSVMLHNKLDFILRSVCPISSLMEIEFYYYSFAEINSKYILSVSQHTSLSTWIEFNCLENQQDFLMGACGFGPSRASWIMILYEHHKDRYCYAEINNKYLIWLNQPPMASISMFLFYCSNEA